jgi:TonB family protein
MLWIALAAAAAAAPDKLKPIVMADDYPATAVRKGEEGYVVAQAVVAPSGVVDNCSIVVSSGFLELDRATCAIIKNRARFTPAKDIDGRKIFGVYRAPVTWSLGRFRAPPPAPDLDVTINQAPAGASLPLQIEVSYRVSAGGNVDDCHLSSSQSAPQVLVNLACQAVARPPVEIIKDHNGRPVDAMNYAKARFRLDKAQGK